MVLLFVPCGVDSLRILEKEKQAVEKGERRGIGIGDESPRGKRQWWGAGKGCVAYYTHELTFYQVTFDQAPASCQEAIAKAAHLVGNKGVHAQAFCHSLLCET